MAKGARRKERETEAAAAHPALSPDAAGATLRPKTAKRLERLEAKLTAARAAQEKRRRRLEEAVAVVRTLETRLAELSSHFPSGVVPSADPPADPTPAPAPVDPPATPRRRIRRAGPSA